MNSNDILELVRAGYSKEEINAMTENEATEKPTEQDKTEQKQEEKTEQKNEEQKQEEKTEQKNEEQKTEDNNDYKALTELVKNLTETVKAMQANNAKKVSAEIEKEITSESAIKSFFEDIPKN